MAKIITTISSSIGSFVYNILHKVINITLSELGITTENYTKEEIEIAVTSYRQTLPFDAVYDILVTENLTLNRIEFTNGNSPSIVELETILNITLLNPIKTGDVITFGNSNYTIPDFAFQGNLDLITFDVADGVVGSEASFSGCENLTGGFDNLITADEDCFGDCSNLNANFTNLVSIGRDCFKNCTSLSTLDFRNVDNFGVLTTGNNIFNGISGKTISVTAKLIHQTSNGGGLEGDLAYLQANNTVTFNWV